MRPAIVAVGLVATLASAGVAWMWVDWGFKSAISADSSDIELVALGKELFATNCASCHGANLEGQANWQTALPDGGFPAPPHDESGHTWHHADQLLFDYTKKGGQAVAGPGIQSNMPGFGGQMSDQEIWAVLAFIKSSWPKKIQERQAKINAAYQ